MYARAGATGGDGARDAPFASIGDGLTAPRVVAIEEGGGGELIVRDVAGLGTRSGAPPGTGIGTVEASR